MFIHEFAKENYLTPRKLMEFLCSSSKNNSTERHPFLTSTHRHEVWPLISAPGNEVLYSDGSFFLFQQVIRFVIWFAEAFAEKLSKIVSGVVFLEENLQQNMIFKMIIKPIQIKKCCFPREKRTKTTTRLLLLSHFAFSCSTWVEFDEAFVISRSASNS